jgi:hypothetical protein
VRDIAVAYNGHAVIVYMCSLVQFLLELRVLNLRPVRCFVSGVCESQAAINSLHTTGVQGRPVNGLRDHPDLRDGLVQGGGVEVALLLLGDLLSDEVVLSRRRSWSERSEWRGRTRVWVRLVFTHLPRRRISSPYISRVFDGSAPLGIRSKLSSSARCCFAAELAIG